MAATFECTCSIGARTISDHSKRSSAVNNSTVDATKLQRKMPTYFAYQWNDKQEILNISWSGNARNGKLYDVFIYKNKACVS